MARTIHLLPSSELHVVDVTGKEVVWDLSNEETRAAIIESAEGYLEAAGAPVLLNHERTPNTFGELVKGSLRWEDDGLYAEMGLTEEVDERFEKGEFRKVSGSWASQHKDATGKVWPYVLHEVSLVWESQFDAGQRDLRELNGVQIPMSQSTEGRFAFTMALDEPQQHGGPKMDDVQAMLVALGERMDALEARLAEHKEEPEEGAEMMEDEEPKEMGNDYEMASRVKMLEAELSAMKAAEADRAEKAAAEQCANAVAVAMSAKPGLSRIGSDHLAKVYRASVDTFTALVDGFDSDGAVAAPVSMGAAFGGQQSVNTESDERPLATRALEMSKKTGISFRDALAQLKG